MKPAKIYSNKVLYDAFTDVITRAEGAYTSDEIKEALRILKGDLNIHNVATLAQMPASELKALMGAVRLADEIAKTTNEVPRLCDL